MNLKMILSMLLILQSFAFVSPAQAETAKLNFKGQGGSLKASIPGSNKCMHVFTSEDQRNKEKAQGWLRSMSPAVIGASTGALVWFLSTHFNQDIANITPMTAEDVQILFRVIAGGFLGLGSSISFKKVAKKSNRNRSNEREKEFISYLEDWHEKSSGKTLTPKTATDIYYKAQELRPVNRGGILQHSTLMALGLAAGAVIANRYGMSNEAILQSILGLTGGFTLGQLAEKGPKTLKQILKEQKGIDITIPFPTEKKYISYVKKLAKKNGWETPPERYIKKDYEQLLLWKEQLEAKLAKQQKAKEQPNPAEIANEVAEPAPKDQAEARPVEDQPNPAEIANEVAEPAPKDQAEARPVEDQPNPAEIANEVAEPAPKDQAEARPVEDQPADDAKKDRKKKPSDIDDSDIDYTSNIQFG